MAAAAPTTIPDLLALRTSSTYQAAERLRRRVGAANMAMAPQQNEEHAAIRLLIGVWEALCTGVRSGSIDRDLFFSVSPVAGVFDTLGEAIRLLRVQFNDNTIGANLEYLAGQYYEWTKTKVGERFRSRLSQQGMTVFSCL